MHDRMAAWLLVALAWAIAALQGCGPRSVVPDPQAITLKAALTEVGEGLAAMVKAQPQGSDFGIYPAEVLVTFNVAASATASGSLMVTPGLPSVTPATERTGMQASVGETANRANTVTVRFANILFAPPEALVQHLSGAQLFELRQAMLGIDPRQVMVPVGATGPSPEAPATAAEVGAAAPNIEPKTAAVQSKPVASPVAPSLPAMKFLSPYKPGEDPADTIHGATPAQLQSLAAAMNDRVGMTVVDPALAEPELRKSLISTATKLGWNKKAVQDLLAKPTR